MLVLTSQEFDTEIPDFSWMDWDFDDINNPSGGRITESDLSSLFDEDDEEVSTQEGLDS